MTGVNVPEPVLAGVIAKTAAGKTSGLVKGAAAVYMVQVTGQAKTSEQFNAQNEQTQLAQMIGQRCYQGVFSYLMLHEADLVDHRYEF